MYILVKYNVYIPKERVESEAKKYRGIGVGNEISL